jgi:hypothetical protein
MSEGRLGGRLVRNRRQAPLAEGAEPRAGGAARNDSQPTAQHAFAVVASGENVVMINTATGQTWAMTSDGRGPVWHPVEFSGPAPRAPRLPRPAKGADAAEEGPPDDAAG